MNKTLTGLVWYGYVGEYKHPPCYIIPKPDADGIFISDIFKKFMNKRVRITIKELKRRPNDNPKE